MLEAMLDQFMKTSDGASILQSLTSSGLSPQQAKETVTATAEGMTAQGGQGGIDLGSLATGLLGGSGGGGLGQLAGMLGGGGEASSSASAGNLDGLVGPVAQFVAQKVGIAPAMATAAVKLVLPKLSAMLTGAARPS